MASNKLPSVQISGTVLSDLFFNTEHLHYDTFCKSERKIERTDEAFAEDRRRALNEDALAFIFDCDLEAYSEHNGDNLADLLVEDFLSRL